MEEKKQHDIPNTPVEEAKPAPPGRPFYRQKKWIALAVCVVAILSVVAVFSRGSNQKSGEIFDVVFPAAYAFGDSDTQKKLAAANPVDDEFIDAIDLFSYKTASQILMKEGNVNYSPLSLYYALALAASGAGGETEAELLSLLGISDQATLSQQCSNLYRQLYTDNEIGKLKIANSLWISQGCTWKDGFIKNAAENFYAQSFSVDFADSSTGETMAKWISAHTNGTLEPDLEINPNQILSIINTVYFYDEWVDRFDESQTAEDVFYLSDSTTANADFMHRVYDNGYFAKGDGFTRAGLDLKNAGVMTFILPDEGVSPRTLLSTPEKIREAFTGGEGGNGEIVWQIPKFSFDSDFDFVDTLKTLGVQSAFSGNGDFSGITGQPAFFSNIQQETHIAIDENGVEASAFTQIEMSGATPPQGRVDMILNRPFIYGITATDGTLLFIGICDSPGP